ncbi:MAG: MTH1187 family thiamine-binding protein [Nitrospinae bacterium]|nr:MTH1187 family thiamine-binding protein [Nitrospinota bacterium]
MYVIADISIVPMGVEASVSRYVKRAHQVLADADLNATLCPYGTVVEGEYDLVTAAIKKAVEQVHAMGVPRITMTIKMGSRTDKAQTAQDKLDAVNRP